MTPHNRIIALLLRLYPAAWRREYGVELVDALAARPLSLRVVADVLRAGVWRRLRAAQPSTLLGVVASAGVIAGLAAWAPFVHSPALTTLIRRSGKTLPAYAIRSNEIYVLFLLACGCWTSLRGCDSRSQCGISAVRMSLISGAPIVAIGVLMAIGLVPPVSVVSHFD